jgi:hypothetical protein
MTTIQKLNRAAAILNLPTKVPVLIVYVQNIIKGLTGNTAIPNPAPTVAALTTALDELQTAETEALVRTKGAVTTRNEKRAALLSLLQLLKASVQTTADASAQNGASIIESAGLAVRKTAVRPARVFAAKPAPITGTAKVVAPSAGHRASYEWEYSIDGAKTWLTLPVTLQAKTTVSGLVAGTTVQFRYRAVTKTGEDNWSAPVSLVVQ